MNLKIIVSLLLLCVGVELGIAKKLFYAGKVGKSLYKLLYGLSLERGLTVAEKQAILDIHNAERNVAGSGNEKHSADGPMPVAVNMMAMEWDDALAEFAQKYVDGCPTKHSDLNVKQSNYSQADISENLCGPTVTIEVDMYGEVHGWSYVRQTCQKGKQCGHYNTLVSWANFRLGCGYKVCKDGPITSRQLLICEFAPYRSAGIDVDGKRHKFQYEYWTNLKPGSVSDYRRARDMYAPTEPCSECPQGWDYCLGSLCATKAQCESDPSNRCVCKIDRSKCQSNGGTFDGANCRCSCPANRYGRNCANECKNLPHVVECGMTCGNSAVEIFLCYQSCESCGKAVGRAYKYWMQERKTRNKHNLKVRLSDPELKVAIRKNVVTANLPNRGNCKNRYKDYFCENIRARKFCTDYITGAQWKHFCAASCNSCGNKEWAKKIAKVMKANGISSSAPSSEGSSSDTGWSNSGGSDSSDDSWGPPLLPSGGNSGNSASGNSASGNSAFGNSASGDYPSY